ncbi:T9SS type A sorting domain-containing protein [uncultured Psychroserpens sp.]|uniref:T9SS type A sorting domain-containing protein n=1 Tax=uncultured Psychroserpens sp. TaxID=255436 RepID=UPI0026242128|nr:T9SS type A sorting domain-containing protein [uncultured Psychroserpens sp.]
MISPNLKWDSYGISKAYFYTLLTLLFFSFSFNSYSQLAFPTAEGFGKHATGGRGGVVIKVTNLNNTGPGSLRNALLASGTRTIVFEVGGTINLTSNIYVTNGNFTLAGQTAPGDGILIRGGMVEVEASNVIIRYIRFRPGPSAPSGADALNITAWSGQHHSDIIIDHCSLSWASDENFDIRALPNGSVRDVTIQNSIMAECGYGSLAAERTTNLTYYRNLYAHNSERNTRKGFPLPNTFDFELINNLIYGFRYATVPSMGAKFTVLNNKYKKSSQTTIFGGSAVEGTTGGAGQTSQTYAYISGNILAQGTSQNNSALSSYLQSTPYATSGIQAVAADQLEAELLDNVGASFPVRDGVDTRLINQYINGNGGLATSGTYPTILGGTAPEDSDNDGMPNVWENQNGLNPNDASDRNIVQADGYTNLEYYLNGMVLDVLGNQVTLSADNETICEGTDVILTASGADSYTWDVTNETSSSITVTPTQTTTYTVTGTHTNGSTTQDEITITVNDIPTANAGNDIDTCQGTAVTLTASGGTSYLWNTGATNASITVNPNVTTTYSVEVTQNGCTSTDSVVVTVNETPDVDAGADQTIFSGESVTLTATGADSYLWSTGETTQSITVTPSLDTSYSVTGTTNNCENTDTVTVFLQDDSVDANAGNDTEICNGASVTLTASGGTTYLWNTGATTASIEVSPNTTTTYTVTAFSVSGNNSSEDSVVVTVNEIPVASAGNDTEICSGNVTTLTATGGTSYLWSTGETSQSISVTPNVTTTYTVEVFENNCSSSDNVTVTVNSSPNVDAGDNITISVGETTTLTATGADTYLWETGATTASINVTPNVTTIYTVTGYSNGCESSDNVTVYVQSETITANAGDDITICNGETTTLTASGGATYLWSTGETTASIAVTPNTTTTYTVTAYNDLGTSSDDDSVTVTVNELPNVEAGSNVTITEGESTTLTATGADAYLWETGATTASINVSPSVTTIYTVTGYSNGCESSDNVTVYVQSETVVANAGDDVEICNGTSVTLTASGGVTYLWNTGETTASISVSPNVTTTYTVTAFNDAQTASDNDSVEVIVNDLPNTNAGNDVTINEGESTILSVSGADSYLWSTGETTSSINVSPNSTTTYTVTGFSNGCETTSDVTVTVNIENVTADAGDDVEICNGNTITLTASGGTSYLWNTGETTSSINVSPSLTTTYTVTAFNSAQTASDSDSVEVIVNELPNTNAGNDVVIVEGESTSLTATGADTYLWNTGETTSSISVSPITTTTYSVTGFSNGCEFTDEVVVTVEPFEFIASAGADQSICQGYETTLTASEGDSYLWSTGETTQSITVNPANTQTYTVTVFIGNYSDDADVMVSVNPNPNVIISNGGDVTILEGEFITLSASGANTYLWNNGATQPNIAVSPSITTTYEVTGFINNCEDTKAVVVNVVETVEAFAGEDLTICSEETVTLTASGGDEYLWNTGETTQSIEVSPDEDTEYSVLVYNALDSDEATVIVFVENCNTTIEIPEESDAFEFIVYQDPISDILKVKINGLNSVSASGIMLYDLSGKVLYTETFNQTELENQSQMTRGINTSAYARGIYIVKLIYNDTSLTKKVPIR